MIPIEQSLFILFLIIAQYILTFSIFSQYVHSSYSFVRGENLNFVSYLLNTIFNHIVQYFCFSLFSEFRQLQLFSWENDWLQRRLRNHFLKINYIYTCYMFFLYRNLQNKSRKKTATTTTNISLVNSFLIQFPCFSQYMNAHGFYFSV